jgi:hypothetical protein
MKKLKPFIRITFTSFLVAFFAFSCNLPKKAKITVIPQTPPATKEMDRSPFENVGCDWQSETYAICEEDSVFKKMGCDNITAPSDFLSLLTPELPLVMCNYSPFLQDPIDEDAEGIYTQGCMVPSLVRMIVFENGNYHLLMTAKELQSFFAPIESADEALAYAIAVTGYQPLYNYDASLDYRYLVDELPETKVEITAEGYEVLLYSYLLCGCGPHTNSISKVSVLSDGSYAAAEPVPAYENPEQDGLCID